MIDSDAVKDYLLTLQNRIVAELEDIDGKGRFRRDSWQRDGGGGGESHVLDGGAMQRARDAAVEG